jgi:hypothetical protein
MQDHPGLEPLQQVVVVSGGPVDGGIALAHGGGVAARSFLRVGPDLVRRLACHADPGIPRKK